MSFDRRQARPFDKEASTGPLAEACYVPQRYEPNYPYPLLVMFHPRGGDEHRLEVGGHDVETERGLEDAVANDAVVVLRVDDQLGLAARGGRSGRECFGDR